MGYKCSALVRLVPSRATQQQGPGAVFDELFFGHDTGDTYSSMVRMCTPLTLLCVSDETVLDPLFSTVSRPFRTVFRGLGAGFWNLGGKMEKVAKQRRKTGKKWARSGLKKVGPMTD